MELVRCFVAVELPQEVRVELGRIQEGLKRAGKNFVRWVSPESVHLTLKFLGWVPADLVTKIVGVLNESVVGSTPFRLETDGLGMFPTSRLPRVVWLGVKGDVQLLCAVQERVETMLLPLGFEKEGRIFSPHLTLGRLNREISPTERREFGEKVLGQQVSGHTITVNGLSLMRSTLLPTGAVYTRIAMIPFDACAT
ncbi:MAG: RNA 2',3'-cyclic phosphodiesterase [Chloroflexi bacterium]|nr:RNA 2',3'-cyclic phosphodiesterase [Chloroflexota bacterium]